MGWGGEGHFTRRGGQGGEGHFTRWGGVEVTLLEGDGVGWRRSLY